MVSHAEYRDSGVPWVGRIPNGWDAVPLMSVLHESKVKNVGLTESNLLSLSFGRIIRKDIDAIGGLLPESFETYQIVEPNHLVFRFTDLQNDQRSLRSARVTERGIITSAYVSARPTGIDARYAEHLMRSYDVTKVFYGLGGGVRQTLKFSDVARLPVILPPAEEQRAIADYLDRETTRIDTLIEEQQRLIDMLRERRRLVVTNAIPPRVSLGSGADKLGRTARIGNGSTPRRENREYWDGGDVPWLNSSVVNQARVSSAAEFVTAAALAECHLPIVVPGSVLVGLTGQGKTRGMATILDIEATVNQHLAYVTPDRARWWPDYLLWLLTAAYDDLRRISEENGSTKGGLTCEALKQLRVTVPSLDEQRRIASQLNEQTAKTDALIAETEGFIELARERRSALITAAVTGQIDVRETA